MKEWSECLQVQQFQMLLAVFDSCLHSERTLGKTVKGREREREKTENINQQVMDAVNVCQTSQQKLPV